MPIVIVGAGAIGGTIGAYLVRAGHEVLFVEAAADHVKAINGHGLTLEGRGTFTVEARAVAPDALAEALDGRQAEVVFLAVKALHTRQALDAIAPHLDAHGCIVSMQNGLEERIIAERVGAVRTLGAFVNFGADYHGPGRIMYGGSGALYLGELDGRTSDRLRRLHQVLRTAFLENTQITDNIWGYLWGKLGYAAMLFATALVDEPIANVLAEPAYRPLLANLAAEAVRVAEAEGVTCEGFDGYDPQVMRMTELRDWAGIHASLDRLVDFNRRSLKQKSGIWRDLAVRKRRTEVDSQLGVVVETGHRHGLTLPLHERLVAMIHDLEAGVARMSRTHLEALRELNRRVYGEPDGHPRVVRRLP